MVIIESIFSSFRKDVSVQTDVYIDSPPSGASSVFLGVRANIGGCWSMYANGFYLWLFPQSQNWTLTGNFSKQYKCNIIITGCEHLSIIKPPVYSDLCIDATDDGKIHVHMKNLSW